MIGKTNDRIFLILAALRSPLVWFWFAIGVACGVGLYLALRGWWETWYGCVWDDGEVA